MSQKLEGGMPPKEQKEGTDVELNFEEVVSSILRDGRISLEFARTEKYPQEAREMLDGTTEEEVRKIIEKQADFSEAMTWYVDRLNESGRPISLSGGKTDRSIGVNRSNFLTIKEDQGKNIKIQANVDLLHLNGKEPEIKVYLYASKIDYDFPRWMPEDGGDGQCTICQGWGCWECGFSGGY
jgi:hypothetical protein